MVGRFANRAVRVRIPCRRVDVVCTVNLMYKARSVFWGKFLPCPHCMFPRGSRCLGVKDLGPNTRIDMVFKLYILQNYVFGSSRLPDDWRTWCGQTALGASSAKPQLPASG